MAGLGSLGKANALASSFFGTTSVSHRFTVRIDRTSYNLGSWSRATGLSVNWEVCQYRTGETWNDVWIYPGIAKYSTIKLSRGACADSQTVQDWLVETSKSNTPLTGGIALVDWTGMPVVTWELKGFFPTGWQIADFDAGSSKVAMETLEISHSGFLPDEYDHAARGI